MNVALKEWAVVVNALGSGRQIVLLRKGGLAEARRGFELRHDQFLLFPTFEHQHGRFIRLEFQDMLRAAEPRNSGEVRIAYLARVHRALPAPSRPEQALALSEHFLWNEAYIRQRYEYRPDLPLFLVLLRVYSLPEARVLPLRASYAGCKSWVNLTEEIDVEGAFPVIEDQAFEDAAARLIGETGR